MKHLLCLAAILACSGSAAAETQFYGTLGSGWEAEQTRSPHTRSRENRIADRDSHIGFKG